METTSLTLVPADSPVLYRPAAVVTDIAVQVLPLVAPMLELMERKQGAGLAAPQVGLGLRFFVSQIQGHRAVVNPSYEPAPRAGRTSRLEGCLTWPGRNTYVSRFDRIYVEWQDLEGRPQAGELEGIDARIFQHETDHVNGITIFP